MYAQAQRAYLPRRLKVGLRAPQLGLSTICHTYEIGADSLFVEGAPALQRGGEVELTFTGVGGESVSVLCVVDAHAGSNLFLRYRDLDHARRQRLEEIIWPPWDGENLLDGLMLMAARYDVQTFSDLMCLTTLLEVVKPRLGAQKKHSQALARA